MSVGFGITFIGLPTHRYIEQTPYSEAVLQWEMYNTVSQRGCEAGTVGHCSEIVWQSISKPVAQWIYYI
jgi:hypothetical protein